MHTFPKSIVMILGILQHDRTTFANENKSNVTNNTTLCTIVKGIHTNIYRDVGIIPKLAHVARKKIVDMEKKETT